MLVGFELQSTTSLSKLQLETHSEKEMRFIKRYRRITMNRALKPWSPLFILDADEVTSALTRGWL